MKLLQKHGQTIYRNVLYLPFEADKSMQKRWVEQEIKNPEAVERLTLELQIDESLTKILVSRDVTTFDEAKCFFRPDLCHLHDPFLMKDMKRPLKELNTLFIKKKRF